MIRRFVRLSDRHKIWHVVEIWPRSEGVGQFCPVIPYCGRRSGEPLEKLLPGNDTGWPCQQLVPPEDSAGRLCVLCEDVMAVIDRKEAHTENWLAAQAHAETSTNRPRQEL